MRCPDCGGKKYRRNSYGDSEGTWVAFWGQREEKWWIRNHKERIKIARPSMPLPLLEGRLGAGNVGVAYRTEDPEVVLKITGLVAELDSVKFIERHQPPGVLSHIDFYHHLEECCPEGGPILIWKEYLPYVKDTAIKKIAEHHDMNADDLKKQLLEVFQLLNKSSDFLMSDAQTITPGIIARFRSVPGLQDIARGLETISKTGKTLTDLTLENIGVREGDSQFIIFDILIDWPAEELQKEFEQGVGDGSGYDDLWGLYRRNVDRDLRRLERQYGAGDFEAGVQLLRMRIRSGLPVDYVRRAAALGDRRAEALGLEPWPTRGSIRRGVRRSERLVWWISIFAARFQPGIWARAPREPVLPSKLVVSFAADVAERARSTWPGMASYLGDEARLAIEAIRAFIEDPSDTNIQILRERSDDCRALWDNISEEALEFPMATRGLPPLIHAQDTAHCVLLATRAALGITIWRPGAFGDVSPPPGGWRRETPPDPILIVPPGGSSADEATIVSAADAVTESSGLVGNLTEGSYSWQKQRLIKYLLGEIEV